MDVSQKREESGWGEELYSLICYSFWDPANYHLSSYTLYSVISRHLSLSPFYSIPFVFAFRDIKLKGSSFTFLGCIMIQ